MSLIAFQAPLLPLSPSPFHTRSALHPETHFAGDKVRDIGRNGGAFFRTLKANSAEDEAKRMGGRKGFYVRPSKAVELGGGFFVPGLEGPRLRVAIGVLAFSLLALNRVLLPGYQPLQSQLYSEAITGSTAAFLLGQALFELIGPVQAVESSAGSDSKGSGRVRQYVFSPSLSPAERKRMEWLVGSVQQVTSAGVDVVVLSKEGSLVSPQPDADTLSMVESFDPGCVLKSVETEAFSTLVDAYGSESPALLRRSVPAPGQQVFGLLPDDDQSAAVVISADGSRVIIVGLEGDKAVLDDNESSWLRNLVNIP